jgi:hypothetical protein
MILVLVIHPFAPDRPFVAMVKDRDDAVRRFGSRADIRAADDEEVFVVDKALSQSAIDACTPMG